MNGIVESLYPIPETNITLVLLVGIIDTLQTNITLYVSYISGKKVYIQYHPILSYMWISDRSIFKKKKSFKKFP